METTKSESGLAKTHVETVLFLQRRCDVVHDRIVRKFPLTSFHFQRQFTFRTYNIWNTFGSSTQ
jgi:hypothetical protein